MLSEQPPRDAIQTFPIFASLSEAYSTLFGNLGLFCQLAAVPFAISVAIALLTLPFQQTQALLQPIALLIPQTIFAVAWHRRTLLGSEATLATQPISWQARHWRFLGFTFVAFGVIPGIVIAIGAVLMFALSQAASALGLTAFALSLLIAIYIQARLSFVLPAVAVEERYGLSDSWRHTKDQVWRILTAYLLVLIPFVMAMLMLMAIIGLVASIVGLSVFGTDAETTVSTASQILGVVIQMVISYPITAMFITILSIAFRDCTGWVPHDDIAERFS